MKKYINIFAVLAMALFVGSCEDELEQEFQYIKVVPGEEIQFGASAAFESSVGSTRTIYGDINEKGSLIEVNWVPNQDRIQIISPHAGGADIAEYQVISTNSGTVTPGNGIDSVFVQYSQATALQRIGEAGLQWTNATEYDFYAMYPSHEQLKEVVKEVENTDYYGLKNVYGESGLPVNGKMIGYLPVTQDPVTTAPAPAEDGESRVVKVEPDMRYAYMAAKAHCEIQEDGTMKDTIQLNFQSLVTALEFDITVNEIDQQSDGTKLIDIMALMLTSKDHDICGKFEYTFPERSTKISDGSIAIQNAATQNYRSITMGFGQNGIQGLAKGDVVKATFFILPSAGIKENFNANAEDPDLKLTVMYKVAGQPQIKTATIKKAISPCKYTHFTNVLLPKIGNDVDGSAWWSALPDNALLSQVSIPVASNVFASSIYFKENAYNNLHQQVKEYTDLWDMGVRGFEFVNRKSGYDGDMKDQPTLSLSDAHFVVDENPLVSSDINFGIAFETLATKLAQNENETLVLVCTYQAITDGYNPNYYVQQLLNYLDDFVAENKLGFTKEHFVKMDASSTVSDLKGKIAIIIRPGDDDRYESNSTTASITLSSNDGTTKTDWSSNVTLIQDWGTAFDVWDRRYEDVAREAQFETKYVIDMAKKRTEPRTMVEDWLWGAGGSSGSNSDEYYEYKNSDGEINDGNNNFDNFGNGEIPSRLSSFNYEHACADGTKAYVQEWARVVPESMAKKIYTGLNNHSVYLWVNWPESYIEKQKAIDGLFKQSVATKGITDAQGLYINSLSGYYIMNGEEGLYPFKNTYSMQYYPEPSILNWWNPKWTSSSITASNMGKGGDHVGLAYDLNKYVYGILSGTGKMQDGNSLTRNYQKQGIVLIDEIETHLHLELQKFILPFLTKIFPNIQFIVTTHSPFVLSSMDNAVAYDLEHRIMIDDLTEYSYEALAEGYFGVPTESSYMEMRLQTFRALLEKDDLSNGDKEQLFTLISDFEKISEAASPLIIGEFMRLKVEYSDKINTLQK